MIDEYSHPEQWMAVGFQMTPSLSTCAYVYVCTGKERSRRHRSGVVRVRAYTYLRTFVHISTHMCLNLHTGASMCIDAHAETPRDMYEHRSHDCLCTTSPVMHVALQPIMQTVSKPSPSEKPNSRSPGSLSQRPLERLLRHLYTSNPPLSPSPSTRANSRCRYPSETPGLAQKSLA